MLNKKYYILRGIIIGIALAIILVTLFVPMVKIMAYDQTKTLVYDKTVSLLQYARELPFLNTDAFDVYFNATGPMWLAVAGILLNYLLLPFSAVIIVLNIVELIFAKKDFAIKNNALLRKLTLYLGYFAVSVFLFEFLTFIITTLMANGYAVFMSSYQNYVVLALGIGLLVCGYLLNKKEKVQRSNKLKNCLGYGLCALFSALGVAFLFMPQYSEYLIPDGASIFSLSYRVTELGITSAGGDYPIGITMYVIFALILIGLFVLIYSIIGLIMALKNKEINWLSARVKRWSMAYLITYTVLYFLILSGLAVLISGIKVDEFYMITPLAFIAVFAPFMPYVFSAFVSYNKNLLRKSIRKNKQNNDTETQQ